MLTLGREGRLDDDGTTERETVQKAPVKGLSGFAAISDAYFRQANNNDGPTAA